MTTDSNPFGFDALAQPFRLLDVDPATPDSGIDIGYDRARQQQKDPEAELAQARAAIKDPTLRLQAELAYPLDCPTEILSSFYADTEFTSVSEVLQMAQRFPPLTKVNFLVRSAARLGFSEQLLMALVDGHTAIDALDIYQTLQKLRHQARHPAPSLISVRNGLDDLLTAHGYIVADRADSVHALADLLLAVKVPSMRRMSVPVSTCSLRFSTPVDPLSIRPSCELRKRSWRSATRLHNSPDDFSQIEQLAEKCRAWATLLDVLPHGQDVEQYPDENIVWENIRGVVRFLIEGQHFQSAQRVMDRVAAELRPFPDQHSRATDLATPFQQQIVSLAGELDRPEKHPVQEASPHAGQDGLRLLRPLPVRLFFADWLSSFCASTMRTHRRRPRPPLRAADEVDSLPPASRGQRYPLQYVRYCHYQQERLRIVKQQIQNQDDIRAYNALASDYNSRCADYFYQDEDLRTVEAEVIAKQKLLEADALRIVSTWPGHAAAGEAKMTHLGDFPKVLPGWNRDRKLMFPEHCAWFPI